MSHRFLNAFGSPSKTMLPNTQTLMQEFGGDSHK